MIAVVMEFLTWLAGYLFSERKSYEGHHRPETVVQVGIDYHPMPELCAYPALWEARVSSRIDYLRVPLKTFYVLVRVGREIDQALYLSNYRWNDVPMAEWPDNWKAAN